MTSNKNECSSKCPGKQPCALDPAVRHTLHLCTDPDCSCHQRDRYQPRRTLALTIGGAHRGQTTPAAAGRHRPLPYTVPTPAVSGNS